MYREFKQLSLPAIDEEILRFWESEQVFKKSIEQKPSDNAFVFYEGPPSANGKPGIHHVMARTVKDLFCRYQTMKGHRVERKGGWDTHGLPIELQVEKELGITKEDIGKKISVDDYNKACRDTVMRYKDLWDDITRKMGYWVDLDNPYITFENSYIESVWHLLHTLYNKKTAAGDPYLYKGFTIQPFSPAAGTGLSSHELNLPGCYREVTDISAVVMFKVKPGPAADFLFSHESEDVRIMAWTTTPWTLPSNVALTVGPDIHYAKVITYNPYSAEPVSVILASDRLSAYFHPENATLPMQPHDPSEKNPAIPYRIDRTFYGTELLGVTFEQLLPYVSSPELEASGFRVIGGNWVTTEDGTGVVHTAPYFGADDFKACKENHIPFIGVTDEKGRILPLVDRQGRFVNEVTDFAGSYVKAEYYPESVTADKSFKSTDLQICLLLKAQGKAFRIEKYKHNYPHCWRTDKPILYYPLDSWFIRASAAKDRMAALNKTINWKPESTGSGRFGQWLENLQDWNLSRSRYWGIPLPIWRTEDESESRCFGTVASLKESVRDAYAYAITPGAAATLSAAEIDEIKESHRLLQNPEFDLHRPTIDQIICVSTAGKAMRREYDLIDVWFDSGAMPYAQWHYPFENTEQFERNFPADFIAEGVDQTRGWFYTLHAIAVLCFDRIAYKNVVSNGLVLDKEGNKMSKSKGNVVDPFTTIAENGADATRWYMISNAAPWENLKFDLTGITESRNKFFGTLFNTYNFFALYANLDKWAPKEADQTPHHLRPELDRWILSQLNSLILDYREAMDLYEPTRAARAIERFVDEHLSNWFVRLSRRRFWKGEFGTDKKSAYETLYACLTTVSQLSASLAPFFSDWLYRNLTAPTTSIQAEQADRQPTLSVHLTDLPLPNTAYIDEALQQRMDYAQRICSLTLSIRKKEKIRVRQPLRKILLPVLNAAFIENVNAVKELIISEVNVKDIEFVTDADGLLKKAAKANFKTLGAKMGKDMKPMAECIAAFSNATINQLEKDGEMTIHLNGQTVVLTPEDLIVSTEDLPGWKVATDAGLTVALDVQLDEALLAEGTARDLVNRIQNTRKEMDFQVTDRITVVLQDHPAILHALNWFGDYICREVLADSLTVSAHPLSGSIELSETLTLGMHVEKTPAA
jgi:isoleucyl-tRNA synthetase